MMMFSRLSLRQLLLGVFLLIAALLSAASVHALWTLDRLAAHSRDSARHAIALTEQAQLLAERSTTMARSARQFLVLDDPAFRARYADAWRDGSAALDAVATGLPHAPAAGFTAWRTQSALAWSILEAHQAPSAALELAAQSTSVARSRRVARAPALPPTQRAVSQQALDSALAPLPALAAQLSDEVKREVARRNAMLLDELEQRRSVLTGQVLASIVIAALLAGGFGLWLARPLVQIEKAIGQLGANRFVSEIEVRGPHDLRRVGQQLNWLRQRLAELEADKARFLRHISHELKTPLAALREGVALLEDGVAGELTPNQREIAGILNQNTQSLQSQIEALLRYNAATFDAQHLQRRPTDAAALLRDVIANQRLQRQAGALKVVAVGTAPPIALDPDKLSVALANLLSNAVRFSPPQGHIRFLLEQHGGKLRVDCLDQGPGVAPADAARIFEPFYQGRRQPSGARRGNGIGLSIVHEYIAAHGGVLQLLPSERGAHFRIELPYETEAYA